MGGGEPGAIPANGRDSEDPVIRGGRAVQSRPQASGKMVGENAPPLLSVVEEPFKFFFKPFHYGLKLAVKWLV